jgi:DNA-binding NtrC family response regulator
LPVICSASLAEARGVLARRDGAAVTAILLDLRLPDGDGLELLREIRAGSEDVAVVVMTAHGSINVAVEAMRAGADDFLMKPFQAERLVTTMRLAIDRRRLVRLVRPVSPGLSDDRFEGFIGSDLAMQAVYRMVEQAARSKATVFITGESGTGKEVCAEAIHRRSDRAKGPFVAINCAAIPKDLIESEIFGHVKGAFTGAHADREGAAARADGGTLFLDEICEMELSLQTKLLRFLQSFTVQRVGSDRTTKVDVRIICATNRDPLTEVAEGRFREDLFYRLHVVPMQLPPLRDRGRDVLTIAHALLVEYAREEGRQFLCFAPDAEAILLAHGWPGNVRELQNVVRNIVVLQDAAEVTVEMLPPALRRLASSVRPVPPAERAVPPAPTQSIRSLEAVERAHIEATIAACDGNMTTAAQRLGISVKTIYRKRQAWAG